MTGNRTDNAVKNAASGIGLRAVGILSQFILRTVFLRTLGVEYAGIGSLFADILNVLSLAELGLDLSMVYALYRPLAEGDVGRVRSLLSFYRRAFRIAGAGVLAAGLLCAPFLGVLVGELPAVREDLRLIFLLYVANAVVPHLTAERTALLKAQQQGRIVSFFGIAAQCAECALSVWYLLAFRRFLGWLLLRLAVNLIKNAAVWLTAGGRSPGMLRERGVPLSRSDKKRLLSDLLCLTAYQVSGVAVYSTDSLFIARFLGPAQVAVAGNFLLIVSSVRTCAEQAAGAVRPSVGHLAATEPPEKQRSVFYQMHFIAFYAACCGSVCLYSLLNAFVGGVWLDPSFCLPSSTVALIVANFYLAVMVYPVEAFRGANGLFRNGWGRPLLTALLNLLLDAVLGRSFGLNGIFAATIVSRVLTQVWFDPYLLFRRVFRGSVGRYFLDYGRKLLITAALCGAASSVCALLPGRSGLPGFALRAAVSLALPQLPLYLLFRKNEDCRRLLSTLQRILKRTAKK